MALGRRIFSKCKSDKSHSFDQDFCTSQNQFYGCCHLTVLISYQVLPHSLHFRHTNHIAVSQKSHCFSHMPFFLPGMFIPQFYAGFFSIVSFLYHSQKSPHIPSPQYSLSPLLTFLLFRRLYYLTFFTDVFIHLLVISFTRNVRPMGAGIWLVKFSAISSEPRTMVQPQRNA